MPAVLQFPCLRGRATGDDRVLRPDGQHGLHLPRPQFGRCEAEQSDAPRPVAELLRGVLEQRANGRAFHQREREERQRTALGDGRGERGLVADAGHRPLRDRVAQAGDAVAERSTRPDRAVLTRQGEIVPNAPRNRADHASNGPKRGTVEISQGTFLTNFERVLTNMNA